jgi:hypothetical protein
MSSLTLLRLGGLAAVLGGAFFVIASLASLVLLSLFDPLGLGGGAIAALYARSALVLFGGVLLSLGIVGLYVHQSEAVGILGLVGFLVAFLGVALLPAGIVWTALLADLGWALFGVSILQARIYPRVAAILLIVGAVISGVVRALLVVGPGSVLAYAGAGVDIVLYAAVAWLGYALWKGRSRPVSGA